jgi:hypothetical protein
MHTSDLHHHHSTCSCFVLPRAIRRQQLEAFFWLPGSPTPTPTQILKTNRACSLSCLSGNRERPSSLPSKRAPLPSSIIHHTHPPLRPSYNSSDPSNLLSHRFVLLSNLSRICFANLIVAKISSSLLVHRSSRAIYPPALQPQFSKATT